MTKINAHTYIEQLSKFPGATSELLHILSCHVKAIDALKDRDFDVFKENVDKECFFLDTSYEFITSEAAGKVNYLDALPVGVSEKFEIDFSSYEKSILSSFFFEFSKVDDKSPDWSFCQQVKKYLKAKIIDNVLINLEKGTYKNLSMPQLCDFPMLSAFSPAWQMNLMLLDSVDDVEEYKQMIKVLDKNLVDAPYELSRYFKGYDRLGELFFIKKSSIFSHFLPMIQKEPIEALFKYTYTLSAPTAFFNNWNIYLDIFLNNSSVSNEELLLGEMLSLLKHTIPWDYAERDIKEYSSKEIKSIELMKQVNSKIYEVFKAKYAKAFNSSLVLDENMVMLACLSDRVKQSNVNPRPTRGGYSKLSGEERSKQKMSAFLAVVGPYILAASKKYKEDLLPYLNNIEFNEDIIALTLGVRKF